MSKLMNNEVTLIRKGYNEETWSEYEKCSYAFYPGCQLAGCEPEIVIKAFDSIRFQKPDTGIFMHCCGIHADTAGETEAFEANAKAIKKNWESLGKPILIMACPGCYKIFKKKLPEIEIISFYELLLDMGVSGGCNSEDYIILDPPPAAEWENMQKAVRELAEEMGVKLHEADETEEELPYLTYSISHRNGLKKQGKEAVHILEMIYGMGASNTHMVHKHDHDHEDDCDGHEVDGDIDCDGNCAGCASLCSSALAAPAPLPTEEEMLENKRELKQVMLEFFWNEF